MKVRLLKPYGRWKQGEVVDMVDGPPGFEGQASQLIKRGTAEKVTKPRAKRNQQQPVKDRAVKGAAVNK